MVKGTIRNLIFDLGGVVIRFDGNYFMDREGITDPEDRKLLMEVLFAGPDWPRIDLGELDEPELLELAKKKLPERLHAAAERLVLHWADPVEMTSVMREFILSCRKNGLGTYLLTNSPRSIHRVLDAIRADELFDGMVISSEIGLAKPGREIFHYTLRKFGLKGEECLFLDDNIKNVWAARESGLQAAWYREPMGKKLTITPRKPVEIAFAGQRPSAVSDDCCAEIAAKDQGVSCGKERSWDTFILPYREESAWYDYDHMAGISPGGCALIIDANGDVFADHMDTGGVMHECTVGEDEDEWLADNFPVEESGNYTYGAKAPPRL